MTEPKASLSPGKPKRKKVSRRQSLDSCLLDATTSKITSTQFQTVVVDEKAAKEAVRNAVALLHAANGTSDEGKDNSNTKSKKAKIKSSRKLTRSQSLLVTPSSRRKESSSSSNNNSGKLSRHLARTEPTNGVQQPIVPPKSTEKVKEMDKKSKSTTEKAKTTTTNKAAAAAVVTSETNKTATADNDTKKKKEKKKKKKKTTTSAITKLQDALEDLPAHILQSKQADKVLRKIDKAVVQLEKQWKEWTINPPETTEQQGPEQVLNVRDVLMVTDPTPQMEPFENVTLHRSTYQANDPSEDRSTVVVGQDFVFAGVWDGHGGTHAAEFTQQHLFDYFQEAYESKGYSIEQAFEFAYTQTDRAYFDHARQINEPHVFFAGTCAVACFVDITTGRVTCANLGDSRAVMGVYKDGASGGVKTVPLSVDHSADNVLEQIRIRNEHPNDIDILVNGGDEDDPDWRVKKLAAFTRSIGDLHMKEKNTAALFNSYVAPDMRILPRPGVKDKQGVIKPKYISTEPDFCQETVKDGFIIIACDGVWDEMESEEAVNIVAWLLSKYDPTKTNIAELFIEETLKLAVRRIAETYEEERKLTLAELKKRPPGKDSDMHRSFLHDDITVVILQLGSKAKQRQAFGGSLFSMLQKNGNVKVSANVAPTLATEANQSRMSRAKDKRESAVRDTFDNYAAEIDRLSADAQRQKTDRQIIEMMLAFEDMNSRQMKILFNAVDVDGNGTLDREEIRRLIKNVIDMDVTKSVIDLAFSEMDTDGSGDVDYEEFVTFFGK